MKKSILLFSVLAFFTCTAMATAKKVELLVNPSNAAELICINSHGKVSSTLITGFRGVNDEEDMRAVHEAMQNLYNSDCATTGKVVDSIQSNVNAALPPSAEQSHKPETPKEQKKDPEIKVKQ